MASNSNKVEEKKDVNQNEPIPSEPVLIDLATFLDKKQVSASENLYYSRHFGQEYVLKTFEDWLQITNIEDKKEE